MKKKFFTKSVKATSYSLIVSALLLALLIVLNLAANAIPKKYTVIDTSVSGMFTLSETSKKFVSRIDKDVTVYLICENGDEDRELKTFIERYEGLSRKVEFKIVDTSKQPEFISKYTSGTLSNYSIIVESDLRFRVINNSELYYLNVENYGKLEATDANIRMLTLYGYPYSTYFNGEKAITEAIEYVVSDNIPTVYLLSGHGETALPDMILGVAEQFNLEYDTLNLLNENAKIPENASGIIINAPTSDLMEHESAKISEYLRNGGKLILFTTSNALKFKNLMSTVEYYGAKAEEGIVYESKSSNHYTNMPNCIVAQINASVEAIKETASSGYKILIPSAHPITLETVRDTVKQEIIFKTSDEAYTRVGETDSEKSVINLGVTISEKDTKIAWISSANVLEQNYAEATSYGNYYYFLDLLSWTIDPYKSGLKEIDGTLIDAPTLTVSAKAARLWSTMFIVVIPVAILALGISVWIRRKKR